jgi:hypothetical protein
MTRRSSPRWKRRCRTTRGASNFNRLSGADSRWRASNDRPTSMRDGKHTSNGVALKTLVPPRAGTAWCSPHWSRLASGLSCDGCESFAPRSLHHDRRVREHLRLAQQPAKTSHLGAIAAQPTVHASVIQGALRGQRCYGARDRTGPWWARFPLGRSTGSRRGPTCPGTLCACWRVHRPSCRTHSAVRHESSC